MTRGKRRQVEGDPVRLTLRLPADTVRRLREVARQRGLSVNGLLDEAAALALLEYELMRLPNEEARHASTLSPAPVPQAGEGRLTPR
jgi:hypothetical protein